MARGRLRDRHQENLKKKLELLKAEQGVEENEPSSEITVKSEPGDDTENKQIHEKEKDDDQE